MIPVGYLVKHPGGLVGDRGAYYDYVLSSDGLYIEAEGSLMAARIRVAECQVRGLAPLDPKVVLRHGLIPQRLFDLALSVMIADTTREKYMAITWEDEYRLRVPEQEGSAGGVKYSVADQVVLDLHSHGKMKAWFSGQDDRDEQGLKLYAVLGKLDTAPVLRLRAGVYGYFYDLAWSEVFDGNLIGVEGVWLTR